jgi:GNAT superfamily N-acetyltransferase
VAGRRYVKELREHAFAITLMDGRSSVARIGVNGLVEGGVMMVRRIDVVPGSRRQRIGTNLYERAAKVACKEYGIPLASDTSRSAMADGFWKKQEANGRARHVDSSHGDYYVLSCPAPKSLAGVRRGRR